MATALAVLAGVAPLCREEFDEETARKQFEDYTEKGLTLRGSVQYILTRESLGDRFDPLQMQLDAYLSGDPSRYRFDIAATDDDGEALLQYFTDGEVTFVCSSKGEIITRSATEGGACASEGFVDDGVAIAPLVLRPPILSSSASDVEDESLRGSFIRTYTRTIAREFVHCYDRTTILEAVAGDRRQIYWSTCFAADGRVLFMVTQDSQERVRWEATGFGSVNDVDFRLPYRVINVSH
jgi:hypothetical protein